MITPDEFGRLQAILRDRMRTGRHKRTFAYTGMFRCGFCGKQVTAEWHYKSGKERIYYRCSDPRGECTKRGITEENLEAAIIAKLSVVAIDKEICDVALETLRRWGIVIPDSCSTASGSQDARIREIDSQRSRLLDIATRGMIDDEAFRAKDSELLRERNRLMIESAKERDASKRIREQFERGVRFARNGVEAFHLGDMERRKEIARSLADYTLRGREITIEVNPVLTGIVRFLTCTENRLEPENFAKSSSHNQEPLFFRQICHVGRDSSASIELPDWLCGLLEKGSLETLWPENVG